MVEINDPQLRESLERHRPVIEGKNGRLDAVSADIKALEQYLVDTVDTEFEFELSGGVTKCPEIDEQQAQGEMPVLIGGESIEGEFEYLAFEKLKGKWRLAYRRKETNGHFGMTPTPIWTDEKLVEHRPLIEAKIETRVRAHRKLSEFVEALARELAFDDADFDASVIPF